MRTAQLVRRSPSEPRCDRIEHGEEAVLESSRARIRATRVGRCLAATDARGLRPPPIAIDPVGGDGCVARLLQTVGDAQRLIVFRNMQRGKLLEQALSILLDAVELRRGD